MAAGNITLDRQAFNAMKFLSLQGETKDWIEAVTGSTLKSDDMYTELKSGVVLCKLMNTLFPGAIKRIHKSSFGAHQMENINFVLKCLKKMGMKEDELFEPGDLHDKKNMMKVFKCISTFANTVGGVGGVASWKSRADANFSMAEIDQWKKDYGDVEMEFSNNLGGDEDEEVDLGPAKPDPVVKADPSDFIISDKVTPKTLGVTLEELLQAVNKVDKFESHETKADTANATSDASLKAAQYAAQLKAASNQTSDSAQKKRLMKAYDDVEAANQQLVDAQNAYQDDPENKKSVKALHDACENMRRAAKQALDVASRRPAQLASESDYPIKGSVSNADVDVGLAELVKAVNTAKDKEGKKPIVTTEETEAASKKAAKFAAQMRRVGEQRAKTGDAAGTEYAKRMNAHADELSAANRAMVSANNAYVQSPDDPALKRAHDEACEALIRAAEGAAKDAKRQPPQPIKRASASDFTISGTVSAADLDSSLNDVLKSVKKVEAFRENSPAKTASNAETAAKRTAFLSAQLRAVAKNTKDPNLKKKLTAAYSDLENANQQLADSADVFVANEDDEARQRGLQAACDNVKQKAAAAVDVAKEAIESNKPKERPKEKVQDVGNADIDAESTPLHFATLKGDMSAVRDLINKGMKVDATNAQGWTPLYTAAWVGNLELIRFFVKQGADVNVKNQEGWTPIFAAVAQGHKHVVKALAQEYNAEVNVQSNQGTTPLYHAAESGRYSISKMLLDAGADMELGKSKSWKPIHGSVYNYHTKVTALLIQRGANLNVHNSELKEYTPLHIAISTKKPNIEIIELLAKKADVNSRNKNGATPLHLAVMWGHEAVTKILLKAGSDLKAKNNKGRTALEVAARNDHGALAELLAKKQGVSVPKLKKKKTQIGAIEAPDAPPPPPDE